MSEHSTSGEGELLPVRDDHSDRNGERFRAVLHMVFLAAITFIVFSRSLPYGFVRFDDNIYVFENPLVLGGLTASGVVEVFVRPILGHWHPLTWVSLMADATVYGTNASGYRATSILLHIANTLLLYVCASRLTKAATASLLLAALFAVHPLHVEPVVWVSSRKDLLSTFFLLLTVLAYMRYRRSPNVGRYTLMCGIYALGLLTKSMLVTLPFLLLLLDYWPFRSNAGYVPRSPRTLIVEKLPMLLMAIVAAVMAQLAIGEVPGLMKLPLATRVGAALYSTAYYLYQVVWPFNLSVNYEYPVHLDLWTQVLPGAAVLVVLTAGAVLLFKRFPFYVVGWFWYLIALGPVSGLFIFSSHLRADRYMYVPLIGLFIVLVWFGRTLIQGRGAIVQWTARGLAFLVIAVACGASWNQIGYWRDDESLFVHALEVEPDNSLMLYRLGGVRVFQGDLDAAEQLIERSLELAPENGFVWVQLGYIKQVQNKYDEARNAFGSALVVDPNDLEALEGFGETSFMIGEYGDAADSLSAYLKRSPGDTNAWLMLAEAYSALGDVKKAERAHEKVRQQIVK